jgi:hypothetical protein
MPRVHTSRPTPGLARRPRAWLSRTALRRWCGALLVFAALSADAAVPFLDTYYSPKNRSRAIRKETRFIILHTTEGGVRGAGEKLARYGEAHYMIDEVGRIYRIIDRKRVAYHSGRSMWDGRTSLDSCSIGIEMVGKHNRSLTNAQCKALRELLAELKLIYRVPDTRILTHSMVAYGAPNRWQPRSHRGRKRCGMGMATVEVRSRLGLTQKPSSDPDVNAKRLVIADPDLHRILYGRDDARAIVKYTAAESNVIGPGRSAWDVARDAYNSPDTIYVFPDGTRKTGKAITSWRAIPSGTQVLIGEGDINPVEKAQNLTVGETPASIAGAEWNASRTLYVLPDGRYFRGHELTAATAAALPAGTRVLAGYMIDGPITARRPAFDFCGPGWNEPDTYFLFPDGSLVGGNAIDPAKIPRNTMVIFKN